MLDKVNSISFVIEIILENLEVITTKQLYNNRL